MSKFRCAKFDGDDAYSWAVFKASDIKGKKSPIFFGEAKPIVSGCSRSEADSYKRQLEAKFKESVNA